MENEFSEISLNVEALYGQLAKQLGGELYMWELEDPTTPESIRQRILEAQQLARQSKAMKVGRMGHN